MWKLNRTQKYFSEIIHMWVRNEGEKGGGIWSFGRVLEKQTNQKQQKKKTQTEDKDMGLSGEI